MVINIRIKIYYANSNAEKINNIKSIQCSNLDVTYKYSYMFSNSSVKNYNS